MMLERLDSFLLERFFTPIAHSFERRTGRSNFYLAWWILGFGVLFVVFEVGIRVTRLHNLTPTQAGLSLLFLIMVSLFMWLAQESDEEVRANPRAVLTPLTPLAQPMRLLWVLLVGIALLRLQMEIATLESGGWLLVGVQMGVVLERLCFVSALYLANVKRPPPQFHWKEKEHRNLVPIPIKS